MEDGKVDMCAVLCSVDFRERSDNCYETGQFCVSEASSVSRERSEPSWKCLLPCSEPYCPGRLV